MFENWNQVKGEDAYNELGLIGVKPGTIVYSHDNGFMLETVNYSEEDNQWVYNGVNHDDWSELFAEGIGDTPEEAFNNREIY